MFLKQIILVAGSQQENDRNSEKEKKMETNRVLCEVLTFNDWCYGILYLGKLYLKLISLANKDLLF